MLDTAALITMFTTLFVVVDPIGLTPIFVAVTRGMDARAKRAIAFRGCAIALGLLAMFTLFGEAVLGFVGISMPAFRVAGGVLLFLTALDMLFERRTKRREDQGESEHAEDPSVFPLAIPLIAGPGAIATIILLRGQHPGTEGLIMVLAVLLAVVGLALVMFLGSGLLERLLGKTGVVVATRVLGMLLAALAVQFILQGLSDFGLM